MSRVSGEFSFELVGLQKSATSMYLCYVMTANCLDIDSLYFGVFSALIIMVMLVIKPLFMVVTLQNLNKSVLREGHCSGEVDIHMYKEWRLGKSRYKVTNVYFHIHMNKSCKLFPSYSLNVKE